MPRVQPRLLQERRLQTPIAVDLLGRNTIKTKPIITVDYSNLNDVDFNSSNGVRLSSPNTKS